MPLTPGLSNLDSDMVIYIHDNTEDEFSHIVYQRLLSEGRVRNLIIPHLPSRKGRAQQIGRLRTSWS